MLDFIEAVNGLTGAAAKKGDSWQKILCNNIVDSLIVGGIAGFSNYVVGSGNFEPALIAFGVSFLIKMKDFRKI